MKTLLLIFIIVLVGCSSRVSEEKENSYTDTLKPAYHRENTPKAKEKIDSISYKSIRGIWTDGTTENATFEINKDSIFYIDQFTSFKYNIANDIIKIDYPDFEFVGHFGFSKDTLVITSEGDTTKYWRFKN